MGWVLERAVGTDVEALGAGETEKGSSMDADTRQG